MLTNASRKYALSAGDDQVAAQGERAADADGRSVDGGEHRLGHLADRAHDRVVALGERLVHVGAPVGRGLPAADVLQVGAGGERAPGARQHDRAHRLVGRGAVQGREQVCAELRVPRVQRRRPVQLDRRGGGVDAHVDRLELDVRIAVPVRVLMRLLSGPRDRSGAAGVREARAASYGLRHATSRDRHLHGARARPLERVGPAGGAAAAATISRRSSARAALALLLAPDDRLAEDPDQALDLLDGLLLAGGADIDAASYDQTPHAETVDTVPERDAFEIALVRGAIERDMPVLGICRGMQLINVALGGTLVQHLPELLGHEEHRRVLGSFDGSEHDVLPHRGLARGERGRRAGAHDEVPPPPGRGPPRRGPARDGRSTLDDFPEAIELPDRRFVLGVQWHPEADEASRVVGALVRRPRARGFAAQRRPATRATARASYTPRAVRLSRAIRATAWGIVAAGVAAPLVRKRVQRAAARDADGRVRGARRPCASRCRARAHATWPTCTLQMWAYLAGVQVAARRRGRAAAARAHALPDRGRPRARPRRAADACACSARSRASADGGQEWRRARQRAGVGALELVLRAARHGRVHARAPSRALLARGGDDLRGVQPRRDRLLARADRAALVRGIASANGGPQAPEVRRMMVEYGEHFWRDGWGSLYSVFGGNPLAAMPSLHFATSVMAALLLAEVGPLPGALGVRLRGDARVRAGVPGGALRRRSARGGRADGSGAAARAARRPRAGGHGQGRGGTGGDGTRGGLEREEVSASEMVWGEADGGSDDGQSQIPAGAPSAAEEEMPRVLLTRRQIVAFGVFILSAVGFLYFVLPKLAGVGKTVHRLEGGNTWWIAVGVVLELRVVRRLHGAVPGGVRHGPSRRAGSAGGRATRSRWRAWSPRVCSRRRARAASR